LDKKKDAIETAIKTVSDDFASGKIEIQLQKNGPLVNPDLVHSQKEAISRSWRAIIEGRAELNQTLINSPNLVDAKVQLKGHPGDKEIYFAEIRTVDGKASVYLTHKENSSQKDSTVLAYLGNPPPRQPVLAAALPIQPLPAQLQPANPVLNPAPQPPLVAANPATLTPVQPGQDADITTTAGSSISIPSSIPTSRTMIQTQPNVSKA